MSPEQRIDSLTGQPVSILENKQHENHDRQPDAQSERLDRTITVAVIAKEEKQAGEKAGDHADQQEKDDELEHGRLRQGEY